MGTTSHDYFTAGEFDCKANEKKLLRTRRIFTERLLQHSPILTHRILRTRDPDLSAEAEYPAEERRTGAHRHPRCEECGCLLGFVFEYVIKVLINLRPVQSSPKLCVNCFR